MTNFDCSITYEQQAPFCSNFWEPAVYSASLPDHPPPLLPLPPEKQKLCIIILIICFVIFLTWGFEGPAREPSGTVGASPSLPSVNSARILSTSVWCENTLNDCDPFGHEKIPPVMTWTSSSSSSWSSRPSIVSSSISSIIPALNVIIIQMYKDNSLKVDMKGAVKNDCRFFKNGHDFWSICKYYLHHLSWHVHHCFLDLGKFHLIGRNLHSICILLCTIAHNGKHYRRDDRMVTNCCMAFITSVLLERAPAILTCRAKFPWIVLPASSFLKKLRGCI